MCHRVDFKFKSDKIEALMAIVIPPDGVPIKIGTCYNHPKNHVAQQVLKEFGSLLFNGKKVPGIFVGDLNSPHMAFGSR